MTNDTEEWRTVASHPLYEVSNLGRVRNVKTGRLKALQTARYGYRWVALHGDSLPMKPGKGYRLVAFAFLPPPTAEQTDVCHNDGDAANNRAENLRWDTHANNQADMVKHGTSRNQNTDITHCRRGHEFNSINTYVWQGIRQCRPCSAMRRAAKKARAS